MITAAAWIKYIWKIPLLLFLFVGEQKQSQKLVQNTAVEPPLQSQVEAHYDMSRALEGPYQWLDIKYILRLDDVKNEFQMFHMICNLHLEECQQLLCRN